MTTLFISDLHLEPERPEITRAFSRFMEKDTQQASELYILGDFFEAWIGDDFSNEFTASIYQMIRQVSDRIPVYFMHGNRDFLIGEQFCHETGCQLLADPTVVNLYGEQVLLMHGDSLCTNDEEYMSSRQQLRNPQWQQMFLSKSLEERFQIANDIRNSSKEKSKMKDEGIMDVTPEEVINIMEQHNVQTLIHGHTHRPAIHDIVANKKEAQRIVLGDWYKTGWVLKVDVTGYELFDFEL